MHVKVWVNYTVISIVKKNYFSWDLHCTGLSHKARSGKKLNQTAELLSSPSNSHMYVLGGFQLHDVTSGNVLER